MNTVPGSHVDRLLTASLVVAPALSLVSAVLYALGGWESDPAGAVFHVLGALAFTLVVVRVATWASDGIAAVLLVVGSIGVAGNVAYGFDAIHVGLGDVSLVDQGGAAVLIKPLGLAFPLVLLLCAVALRRVAPRWVVALIGLGGLAFPIANIGNIPALGVVVWVLLAVGFGALAGPRSPSAQAGRTPARAVEESPR
ncbi:hypothetical protein [Pseudonocardia broussonetiae]|uniref:Uncharacterized protein n=1 Tax=Pseudonocardia broussonetiae TaxID=2736640 RepID=A0A6M6JG40_9PSEU|nr:hypothetical protein [Pseudonocardia broussonetiae]QJY46093.1 hypothetical protein HOP40_09995 [Pseudonocardia broussonetiae]